MTSPNEESIKGGQLADNEPQVQNDIDETSQKTRRSGRITRSNGNHITTNPCDQGLATGNSGTCQSDSQLISGLHGQDSRKMPQQLRPHNAATYTSLKPTASISPVEAESKLQFQDGHCRRKAPLDSHYFEEDTEVTGLPPKKARTTLLLSPRHPDIIQGDETHAGLVLSSNNKDSLSSNNCENSSDDATVSSTVSLPAAIKRSFSDTFEEHSKVKDEEEGTVTEIEETSKRVKKNPNAGRKRDSVNFGGIGEIEKRRKENPQYWELHDDCVEVFASGGNPKMRDFRDRLNDSGVPFTTSEFRSLKDHANPNKNVGKAPARERKEKMTRQILEARAARKAAARKAAAQDGAMRIRAKADSEPSNVSTLARSSLRRKVPASRTMAFETGEMHLPESTVLNQVATSRNPFSGPPRSINASRNLFSFQQRSSGQLATPAVSSIENRGGRQVQPVRENIRGDMSGSFNHHLGFNQTRDNHNYHDHQGFHAARVDYNWGLQERTTAVNINELYGSFSNYRDSQADGILPLEHFYPHDYLQSLRGVREGWSSDLGPGQFSNNPSSYSMMPLPHSNSFRAGFSRPESVADHTSGLSHNQNHSIAGPVFGQIKPSVTRIIGSSGGTPTLGPVSSVYTPVQQHGLLSNSAREVDILTNLQSSATHEPSQLGIGHFQRRHASHSTPYYATSNKEATINSSLERREEIKHEYETSTKLVESAYPDPSTYGY